MKQFNELYWNKLVELLIKISAKEDLETDKRIYICHMFSTSFLDHFLVQGVKVLVYQLGSQCRTFLDVERAPGHWLLVTFAFFCIMACIIDSNIWICVLFLHLESGSLVISIRWFLLSFWSYYLYCLYYKLLFFAWMK